MKSKFSDQSLPDSFPDDEIRPVPVWMQEIYGSSALIVWAAILTNQRTKEEPEKILESALEALKNDGTFPIEKKSPNRPQKDWKGAKWNGLSLDYLSEQVAKARPPGCSPSAPM